MIKYIQLSLFLSMPVLLQAQNFNRPVPDRFLEYEFVKQDTGFHGQYFMAPFFLDQFGPYDRCLAIMDEDGYLLWYSQTTSGNFTNFKYYPEHNLFSFSHRLNAATGYFKVMDTNFFMIDSIAPPVNGFNMDDHEFQILPNRNYLISGRVDSVVDLSAYTLNGQPGSDTTHIRGFTIQEFDSMHNVVFQWNSNDYVNPLEAYEAVYGYVISDFDYCHGNAIDKDTDGNYLVSFRHMNAIYKINKTTGNVIWKLGGKSSDFTFTNDPGFSGQHDVRRLANGNISLFDNGNMSAIPKRSRAVEYSLDTTNWVAASVWEYTYTPGFYSSAMGNHQTTSDNYHLINYGLNNRPNPSLVLLDSDDEIVTELFFRDSAYTYRGFTFDLDFNIARPSVQCIKENGIITLIAQGGYQSYFWNTGATTSDITVSDTGTYMVWVNKGIGMTGSLPIHIEDINSYCNSTSLSAKPVIKTEDLVVESVFDLLGRRVTDPLINQLYLVRYHNGMITKELWKSQAR